MRYASAFVIFFAVGLNDNQLSKQMMPSVILVCS